MCVHAQPLSRVWLFATPWTVDHQAPLSLEFSRQEYWSALPFPAPGDLPDPGIEPSSVSCIGRRILYHFVTWKAPPSKGCLKYISTQCCPCVLGGGWEDIGQPFLTPALLWRSFNPRGKALVSLRLLWTSNDEADGMSIDSFNPHAVMQTQGTTGVALAQIFPCKNTQKAVSRAHMNSSLPFSLHIPILLACLLDFHLLGFHLGQEAKSWLSLHQFWLGFLLFGWCWEVRTHPHPVMLVAWTVVPEVKDWTGISLLGSRLPPLTFVGEHLNSLQLDLSLWAAWKPTRCRARVVGCW